MIADSYTAHPALVQVPVQVQVHVNVQVNVNASNPQARLPLDAVLRHLFGNRTKPSEDMMKRCLGYTIVGLLASVLHDPIVHAGRSPSRLEGAARRVSARRRPPIRLINPHFSGRNRRLTLTVLDGRGRVRRAAIAQLNRFMRCRRTGRRHRIHPRLARLMYRVARHFNRPIYVYSGFRHRRVSRLRGSQHTKGRAVDMRVAGVSKLRLRDYLLLFKRVGVGYYTQSPFVHLDVRSRSAFWIDFSGAGEAPRYAQNARELLLKERRRGIEIREPDTVTDHDESATEMTFTSAVAHSARLGIGLRPLGQIVVAGPAPLGPDPACE